MMTTEHGPRHLGQLISEALDPHQRAAMLNALDAVISGFDEPPSVALLGWKAATFVEDIHTRVKSVTIIEGDDTLYNALAQSLAARGYGPKVRTIHKNILDVAFDDADTSRVDLAVATLTETWFIGGNGAATINHVRQNILKAHGVMIPRRAVHLFELAASTNSIGPIGLRVPRYTRPGEPVPVLSEAKHFITQSFDAPVPDTIDDTIYVKPLLDGTITGLRLRTIFELAPNVIQATSASGVQSILVPLREDIDVETNQPVSILIRYKTGEGLGGLRFSARALPLQQEQSLPPELAAARAAFERRVRGFISEVDARGRAEDLDRVVSYTIQPHGDVSRLTALFWTIDDEFHKPLSDLIDSFRQEAATAGAIPEDETIYSLMLETYNTVRKT